MSENIAVIGLGTMGGRAAARLASQSNSVQGYDPDAKAQHSAEKAGIKVCATADEAIRGAKVIILSLPLPEHVRQVAHAVLVHAAPGTVVVDISTIDPATAREAAAQLLKHEVSYLDAPVLGRPDRCGNWTLVVGGSADALAQIRALLEASIAARVVHFGEVGSGSVVKLLNNLMFGAINAITAEALAICRAAMVDQNLFIQTVADSGAATVSNLFRELAPRIATGDFEPTFALNLLHKDNRLALHLAEEVGVPPFLASSIDLVNTVGLRAALGTRDTGAIYKVYANPKIGTDSMGEPASTTVEYQHRKDLE